MGDEFCEQRVRNQTDKSNDVLKTAWVYRRALVHMYRVRTAWGTARSYVPCEVEFTFMSR